mmetsp:Transcript_43559/g.63841  ORF Transcript_43559/g.63841 Transcript_43559/m.63841 type:complete len:219 (+) Transcript_43559:575-1231(+)
MATLSSSSTWNRSSVDLILWYTSLYSTMSITMVAQRSSMPASACSMASSLLALAESSPMKSPWAYSCSSNTEFSVNASEVGSKGLPTSALSASQCRSRMPGFFRSMISGMVCRNWSTRSHRARQLFQPFSSRPSLPSVLLYCPAAFSISSTSSPAKTPVFQPSQAAFQSRVSPHICRSFSRSFSTSLSSLCSGEGMPKMSSPTCSRACWSRMSRAFRS